VSELELAIPFGTEVGSLSDLRTKLTNHDLLDLVFSGSATLSTGAGPSINYDGQPLILLGIDLSSSKKLSAHSDRYSSVWLIKFVGPIVHGSEAYVRLRFEVDNLGRTWIWRKSFLSKNGALIDFRVGDARGTDAAQRNIDSSRFIAISKLYLFVVAPAWLELRTASPQLHYIRLLEGRPWWRYLDLATSLIRDEKLAIYQWREKNVGDAKKSFHAFLDLSRHNPIPTLMEIVNGLLPLLAVIVSVAALVMWWNPALHFMHVHILKLGAAAVGVALFGVFKDVPHIRTILRLVRQGFRNSVKFLLRQRAAG
jgi:hypothetical protein